MVGDNSTVTEPEVHADLTQTSGNPVAVPIKVVAMVAGLAAAGMGIWGGSTVMYNNGCNDRMHNIVIASPQVKPVDVANPDIGDAGCKKAADVTAEDGTVYTDTAALSRCRAQNALLVAAHTPVMQLQGITMEARNHQQLDSGKVATLLLVYSLPNGDSAFVADSQQIAPTPGAGNKTDVDAHLGISSNPPRKTQ